MAIREFFASARCINCVENHPTSNCSHKGKSRDVKCMLCEGNHLVKGYMVYKDLQRRFLSALQRKVIILKP